MLVQEEIDINVAPIHAKYWKNKGYNPVVGTKLTVKISDLPEKSSIPLDCICDSCGRKYNQRKYRNLSVCGYCITSNRMKNNKLGSKNKVHICPDVNTLKSLVESNHTKTYLADYFQTNICVLNRWLKENNLYIRAYRGTKYFKTEMEENDAIETIQSYAKEGYTISDISKKMVITRQIVKYMAIKNNIKINDKFQVWSDQYNTIVRDIQLYIDENKTKTLIEISDKYNISIEQLKKAFREHNVNPKIHSYNKSKGELECRDFIRSLGFQCDSYKFEKTFEIDCYISSKQFGIEYCGEYWHRYDSNKKNKMYHKEKTEYFLSKDITLMTIFENEWKNKRSLLESMIKVRLGIVDEKVHARKCTIKKIDKKLSDAFHSYNHISGKTASSLHYGLYYKNDLVSVLSLMKSRFDKNYEYEISRFSTKRNTLVIGGLSKLFTHFIHEVNPISCMTYSDLRFGEGKSYEKIGFTLQGSTPPNYHYYHNKVGVMENRMKYQKSKLKNMTSFDTNKTEFQIMGEEGYYILYDCGNKKYGWRK